MRQKSVNIKISWSEYLFEKWLETDAKVNLRKSNTSKEKKPIYVKHWDGTDRPLVQSRMLWQLKFKFHEILIRFCNPSPL